MTRASERAEAAPRIAFPPLKGRFPFRLGTTSYILPAGVAANVGALAPVVDDIEVVIFESGEVSPLPDDGTLDLMRRAAARHGVTYTVHLPLDADLASPDPAERGRSAARCARVIERMRAVDPFAYVAHVTGGDGAGARESLEELARAAGAPALVCVENVDDELGLAAGAARDVGASLCLDVGHAILSGHPVERWLDEDLARVRVVHVHGVADGKDHRDAGRLPEGMLARVVGRLAEDAATPRVVTLEVFGRTDLRRSLAAMERLAP